MRPRVPEIMHRDRERNRGFPGDSGVRNLPASAGDMGLIPESGRSLMLGSN